MPLCSVKRILESFVEARKRIFQKKKNIFLILNFFLIYQSFLNNLVPKSFVGRVVSRFKTKQILVNNNQRIRIDSSLFF